MKLLYAPDTADHPNWGCRFMGDWYRDALQRLGAVSLRRIGSRWFFREDAKVPAPATWPDLLAIAQGVRDGRREGLAEVLPLLAACDLVFMNGENFIRPGTLKGRRLLMLAYLAKIVFGKPVVMANLSLDLSEPALAEIAARVLPLLDEVQIRDEVSAGIYRTHVPQARLVEFADVGWAAMPAPLEGWASMARRDGHFNAWPDHSAAFDAGRPYVTVSASSAFAGAARGSDPADAFVALCRRLAEDVAQVVLVAPCEIDAAIMRKVQAATGFPLLGLNLPVRQGIDVLGNARVHVGGRWHPGIFAATGGTPLVAMDANTHKMATLMQQLHPDEPVFDALGLANQVDAIVARARAQLDAGPGLRAQVSQRAAVMRARIDGNLDFVRRGAAAAAPRQPASAAHPTKAS
ncbi:MAG TPA: polysaccharide pyruvyl transferase family protein [Thermomonas sp.]|nr:polysaccharide pyruvyl transferase family protein [Thermomonas sp.]